MSQPERQASTSAPIQWASIALVVLGIFFMANIVSRGINLIQLIQLRSNVQATNVSISEEIVSLNRDVEYFRSDGYIEQAARTVLLWGRPGENLIITPANRAAPTPVMSTQTRP